MTGSGFLFIVWAVLRYYPWITVAATALSVGVYFVLKKRNLGETPALFAILVWIMLHCAGLLGWLLFNGNRPIT